METDLVRESVYDALGACFESSMYLHSRGAEDTEAVMHGIREAMEELEGWDWDAQVAYLAGLLQARSMGDFTVAWGFAQDLLNAIEVEREPGGAQ